MATLDMVRLRSKYPNSGRMTVRFPMPLIDAPMGPDLDVAVDGAVDQVLREALKDTSTDATAMPQVAEPRSSDGETPAGKGRHAQ